MNAAGSSDSNPVDTAKASSAVAAEASTPGELLRRERERRSMSLLKAAEELHLDTRFVVAIEENRFEELGVPVYARGHLRKYASLLGLSPQLIIERYEALTHRPEVPMPVRASVSVGMPVGLERRSYRGPLWLAAALIVLAVGWWIYGWWNTRSTDQSTEALLVEPTSDESTAAVASPATTLATSAVETTSSPAVASASTTASPSAPDVRLRLEYSNSSWTEIYDAAGKRLMFGLGETGRVRTVSGTPPLRITLGNASAVTVQVNDSPVVVPRRSGKDSARFLVAASGAVQMMSGEVPVE